MIDLLVRAVLGIKSKKVRKVKENRVLLSSANNVRPSPLFDWPFITFFFYIIHNCHRLHRFHSVTDGKRSDDFFFQLGRYPFISSAIRNFNPGSKSVSSILEL